MAKRRYVAVDLGAESGRVIAGVFDGAQLNVEEIYRFDNVPLRRGAQLHWNSRQIMNDIVRGLERLSAQGTDVSSVAVDTWGIDFGLLDGSDSLIDEPFHYRDARSDGMTDRISQIIARERLFDITGIQPSDINTLCQLYSMVRNDDLALKRARHLLMMPDLVSFFLSGALVNEYTIATTSQCIDIAKRGWAVPLLERLEIPSEIFGELVMPGTTIGRIRAPFSDISGFAQTVLVAPACHDTASAVAAIPAATDDFAYISSGTWSLMGVSSGAPSMTSRALELGFTNEGGADGRVRVLKNITGLWLIQQCRKSWVNAGVDVNYEGIAQRALRSPETDHVFDPDHASLRNPDDMPSAIVRLCSAADEPLNADVGAIARTIFQSLACKYRQTLDRLHELTGMRPSHLHIVGGGSKNALLCQLTADACGIPVRAGPAETTALGNLLAQLIASGECLNWSEARTIVSRSSAPIEYVPRPDARWDCLLERLTAANS